jgi:DNA-binding NarL/FixJ family response regulator
MEGNNQESAIRVLVVDDQRLMCDGIASLLSIQEGIEVVGTASDGKQALEQALASRPDVILMDVRMPVMDGVEAAGQIRRQLPSCQILMLTTFDDEQYVIKALQAGASGYLLKDIPANDLAKAVRAVHKRIYQLDPAVARKLLASLSQAATFSAPSHDRLPTSPITGENAAVSGDPLKASDLTVREIEVLRLIARGATNREIAENLVISEGTVKNHISSILSRLGLRDRTQAAIYARECGLL